MTREQFDDLFVKAKIAISPKSAEEAEERIAEYAKDIEHVTLQELALYLQMESIKYTNDLVYTLFVSTLEFDEK